jgi:hypothetical protein
VVAWNLDPPDLCLLSSKDCRHESPVSREIDMLSLLAEGGSWRERGGHGDSRPQNSVCEWGKLGTMDVAGEAKTSKGREEAHAF